MVWCCVQGAVKDKRLGEWVKALVPLIAEGDIGVDDEREQTEIPPEGSQQAGRRRT